MGLQLIREKTKWNNGEVSKISLYRVKETKAIIIKETKPDGNYQEVLLLENEVPIIREYFNLIKDLKDEM